MNDDRDIMERSELSDGSKEMIIAGRHAPLCPIHGIKLKPAGKDTNGNIIFFCPNPGVIEHWTADLRPVQVQF